MNRPGRSTITTLIRVVAVATILALMPLYLGEDGIRFNAAIAGMAGNCTASPGSFCKSTGNDTTLQRNYECNTVFGLGCNSCCWDFDEQCVINNVHNYSYSEGDCDVD
ncbi:MAG TPA: hypothetical protein VE133_03490 [Candidatus Sulfotelmatobacter sp.]|nr:hypothetical protein [Candidatus Sulfotelmatobacter sp.]